MSADNHANYTKIGFIVLSGVAAICALLIYLGGITNRGRQIMCETYCVKAVSGLSVGSAVNFRGVKVGKVTRISFVGNDYDVAEADNSLVRIEMGINPDLLGMTGSVEGSDMATDIAHHVKRGLRVIVTASGITGLSRMEFDMRPEAPPPVVRVTWKPRYPYIPSADSLLDSFSDSATKVMNQINRMDIQGVWSNINTTVESLSSLSYGVQNAFDSRRDSIDRLCSNLEEASASLRVFADRIKDNPALLLRKSEAEPLDETR